MRIFLLCCLLFAASAYGAEPVSPADHAAQSVSFAESAIGQIIIYGLGFVAACTVLVVALGTIKRVIFKSVGGGR